MWGGGLSRFKNTLGQSMGRLTESVFPGARNIVAASDLREDSITTGEDTSSSLVLQMLLYFNSFYAVVYGAVSLATIGYKVKWVTGLTYERIIFPIMIGVWTLVEGPRIYVGMKGNLRGQVAKLSTFFFISFVPQAGIVGFLLFGSQYTFPIEHAMGFIMLIFLIPEIILGYLTTRRAIRAQTARFFVERWTGDKEEFVDEMEMKTMQHRGTAM